MNAICELWQRKQNTIKDGLYLSDGRCFEFSNQYSGSKKTFVGDQFDLDDLLLNDPDYLSELDVTTEMSLCNKSGFLCCGEGSFGSEGFFAYIDNSKNLIWIAYFEFSNPFVTIKIQEDIAVFESTNGLRIQANITQPEFSLRNVSAE